MTRRVLGVLWVIIIVLLCTSYAAAATVDSLKAGKAELKAAGPLAFGPDGILFVGDAKAGAVWAVDTADRLASPPQPINIDAVGAKIAGLLGTSPDEILINDLAVNPISNKAYVSVSRGRGPDAHPVILRTDVSGGFEIVDLSNIRHAMVGLPNIPGPEQEDRRGRSPRLEAITDLAFVDGNVIVAGLSNEEFASNLRSIPFPFETAGPGTSVEIFHGAHGRFETNSPVRTFVPFEIENEPYILAAYTCTPLVKFPMSQLKPGTKVVGTTIAELGNRNRPLDMITYSRGGHHYMLMNNSSRGVMKLSLENLDQYDGITKQTDVTGVPYETIASLKGVLQLDKVGPNHALLLVQDEGGSFRMSTIDLP